MGAIARCRGKRMITPVCSSALCETYSFDIYLCPVSAYFRKRADLFTASLFLGGAVSAIVFSYGSREISSYFDVGPLHRVRFAFLIAAYLLPTLAAYTALYLLNRMCMLALGRTGLEEIERSIVRALIDSALSGRVVVADPEDLLGEMAWDRLRRYWRAG